MIIKKKYLIRIPLFIALILSGCTNNIDIIYTFNNDDTILEKYIIEMEEDDQYQNFHVRNSIYYFFKAFNLIDVNWYQENQLTAVEAYRYYNEDNFEDSINKFVNTIKQGKTLFTGAKIVRQQSFAEDIYEVYLTVDLTNLESNIETNSKYKIFQDDKSAIIDTIRDNKITVSIISNGNIKTSNADNITTLDNGQQQYSWIIKHNQNNTINFTLTKINEENVQQYNLLKSSIKKTEFLLIILTSLLIILAIIFVKIIGKAKLNKRDQIL